MAEPNLSYGFEPRSLRYFIAVAELKNFNSASEKLNITQPALTKSIQKLEDQLQVLLFDRHPRGLELTPFGRALYRHAVAIQGNYDHALREILSMRDATADTVQVGAGPTWQASILPDALVKFHESHPNVFVQIQTGLPEDLASKVRSSALDFAVAAFSELMLEEHANPNFADMTIEPLMDDNLCIVARSGHPIFENPKLGFGDLLEYPWVSGRTGSTQPKLLARLFARQELVAPRAIIEANDTDMRLALVARSDFLTFTSERIFRSNWANRLRIVDIAGGMLGRKAGLITRHRATQSPASLALVAEIRVVCARLSCEIALLRNSY